MFKVNKREDTLIVVLIIILIGVSIFIFFKGRSGGENLKGTIKVEKEVKKKVDHLGREESNKTRKKKDKKIFVQIGGAVNNPGVYRCQAGERIYQVLKKAGGVTQEANLNELNLVAKLRDGSKIIVPEEGKHIKEDKSSTVSTKVNINTASQQKLEELTGVGPVTAEKIVKYRQEHGSFSSLKALMKVSGIGSKTFAKLKSQIAY